MFRTEEPRRRVPDNHIPLKERFRKLLRWPLVIAFAFWPCAYLIVLSGSEGLPYFLNQSLPQPVLSRINFDRVNQIRTAERRKTAQQEVPNYFRLNQGLMDGILSEFRDLHAAVKAAESYEKYTEANANRWELDQPAFEALKSLTDDAGSAKFMKDVDTVAKRLAAKDMIEQTNVPREVRSTAGVVMVDRGEGNLSPVPIEKLTYAVNADQVERLANDLVRQVFSPQLQPALVAIVKKAIAPAPGQYRPVYVYDSELTKAKIAEAETHPPVKDSYESGDLLVKAGILDGEGLALLKAEHEEYLRQRLVDPVLSRYWREEKIGLLGVIFLLTAGLAVFTVRVQPRIADNPLRTMALALLLLFMLAVDRFVLRSIGSSPIWSVTTITMTAAILTIAYSQTFALGVTTGLALLTVLTLDARFGTLIVLLSVSTVTVLLLEEIRTRLRMVEIGGITALAAAICTIVVGLSQQQDLRFLVKESAFAALAALAGTSIVLVLLPLIEKLFRITTNLTLLEWADTSNPLLRQLVEKAPGTWQHSHLLGSMAETASEEIGANGLLVRVGAYYHDIGKMCKPNYFVENQSSKASAHRGLAPTMSLLVILAHVKDGLALAKEYRLPPVLHQFILEHHGTTVVKYFHAMAAKEAKSGSRNDREVSETEFRYPGPKPHSKEAAILMLCDGVEGAVRALADPTAGRIENVVHEIVMDRLMDGQFDDCEITLKELAKVEDSLVRSLRAIHHGRISYPTTTEGSSPQTRSA